ncbi:hypothetical protein BJX76DRAFT_354944 [Aspergillus varians]
MGRSHRGNSDASCAPPSPSGQTFPLAHPPPKPSSCLRLSSRLLLQIQQLQQSSTSSITRAIPILELYQPSSFGKSVSSSSGSRKAHKRDLYLIQSEPYTHLRNRSTSQTKRPPTALLDDACSDKEEDSITNGNGLSNDTLKPPPLASPRPSSSHRPSTSQRPRSSHRPKSSHWPKSMSRPKSRSNSGSSSADESERQANFKSLQKSEVGPGPGSGEHDEAHIVAVIHTSPKPKSKGDAVPDAELFFPLSGVVWEASSPAPGRYRFRMAEGGSGGSGDGVVFDWEKRPSSRGGAEKDDEERFVFGVSSGGEKSLRRPWLAQLTKRGMHVGGLEGWQGEVRALTIDDGGAGLYTLILTMGVWVARAEKWVS